MQSPAPSSRAGTNKRQLCRVSSLCTQRPGWRLGNSPSAPRGFLGCCHPLCLCWKARRARESRSQPGHIPVSPSTRPCRLAPVPALEEGQGEDTQHHPGASSAPAKPIPAGLQGEEGAVAAATVPFWGESPHGTPRAALGPGGCPGSIPAVPRPSSRCQSRLIKVG